MLGCKPGSVALFKACWGCQRSPMRTTLAFPSKFGAGTAVSPADMVTGTAGLQKLRYSLKLEGSQGKECGGNWVRILVQECTHQWGGMRHNLAGRSSWAQEKACRPCTMQQHSGATAESIPACGSTTPLSRRCRYCWRRLRRLAQNQAPPKLFAVCCHAVDSGKAGGSSRLHVRRRLLREVKSADVLHDRLCLARLYDACMRGHAALGRGHTSCCWRTARMPRSLAQARP